MVGKTLGHYEILEPLGKGGMGEVYRARDTKLDRDVAIKVLPEDFATDPERLARFEREAKLLAALNHPNIAAIYGLEDEGEISFLAMELAEGQTLAKRLSDGAVGVDESLKIALQIAEAVEAAHERGIVHRDLKPANIQVATEGSAAGQVKVLDFGLAKAFEADGTSQEMSPDLSHSPTMAAATRTGVIMGTAAYMSPEQARGKPVDKRTDIWAFGCVVFEMLTGKRAFQGETVTDILAAIVHQEPQWEALPPDTPLRIRDLLGRCLKKQADERLRDVGECRIAVKEYLADPEGEKRRALASAGTVTARGIPWKLAAPIAAVLVGVTAVGMWIATRPAPPTPELPVRFEIPLPSEVNFSNPGRRVVAISPDGSRIVFVADGQLWMRLIGDLVPTPISGTEDARSPFFSPDGQQIGFQVADTNELKRVAVTGGAPVLIGTIGSIFGASWAENDMIYFGRGPDGIWQVPGAGGTPEVAIEMEPDERAHGPQLLPGGEWLLFTLRMSGTTWNEASIVAQSLVTEQRVELIQGGTEGRWVPTGHLVYVLDGTLFAVAFDPGAMEPPSGPASMVEGIRMAGGGGTGAANYGFTSDGGLVYVPGTGGDLDWLLVWVDRTGRAEPVSERRGTFQAARLSPDGRRIAVEVSVEGVGGVWILGIEDDSFAPLNNEGVSAGPLWTPDSQTVLFNWGEQGGRLGATLGGIYARDASFGSEREEILQTDGGTYPISWSGDGEDLDLVLHEMIEGQQRRRILVVPFVGEDRTAFAPLDPSGQFNQRSPMVSPDGRWVAYVSTQSGRDEVYMRPFPDGGTRVQISNNGGVEPMWGADSSELFYREMASGFTSRMISAQLSPDPEPRVTGRTELFSGTYYTQRGLWARTVYDYDRANDRFLMVDTSGDDETNSPTINVVLNWFEELKQRVPAGR